MGLIPVFRRSPEERKSDVESVLNCFRQENLHDDHDMADDFKRIDQMMPKKKGETLIERAMTIESCLDWCRNKNVSPVDAPTHPGFSKHRSIPISRRSPEERQKDVDRVLNWRRAGKPEEMDTPTDEFAKIDKM